ncbi:MAG: PilZ domain-containing protein [Deltaproteobacteria bacterium]|nr:PilZ domain-containing protein [Deltaproteobacteria bacterium]
MSAPPPDDEPTRAQRVPTSIVATVTAGKRSGVRFRIENISITGAKLEGPLTLGKGEKIGILFEAEGTSVQLVAEIVRVDSPDLMTDQIAARFVDPSPEAQQTIETLVNKLLEEQGDDEDDASIVMEPGEE